MEVDMVAAVSIATETAVSSLLPATELQPSNVILKTYTEKQTPVKGVMSVEVRYGEQHQDLWLIVVGGSGPCLMGRDWLKVIRLDWRSIAKVSSYVSSPDAKCHYRRGIMRCSLRI